MLASTPVSLDIGGFRRAAVLVPVLEATDGLSLLFTVRASSMRQHAGQIAFPGGRLDPGEEPVGAALRETMEEIGLDVPPDSVLGRLDDQPSPYGYVATPVVARVPWPQVLRPNALEVADTFVVPLTELQSLKPTSELRRSQQFERRLYSYRWREHNIWGFTGNVVKNLLDVLAIVPEESVRT